MNGLHPWRLGCRRHQARESAGLALPETFLLGLWAAILSLWPHGGVPLCVAVS